MGKNINLIIYRSSVTTPFEHPTSKRKILGPGSIPGWSVICSLSDIYFYGVIRMYIYYINLTHTMNFLYVNIYLTTILMYSLGRRVVHMEVVLAWEWMEYSNTIPTGKN